MTRALLLPGILLIAAAPLCAQTANPQHTTPGVPARQAPGTQAQGDTHSRIVARTELVLVPVTVKDSRGELVGDLEKNDFRVFEDGVEQQIVLFDSDPFPLSAVVLIDNNLATKQAEQVQKSLLSISAGFGPNDEVALMTYDEIPESVGDFSSSNDVLFTELKRLDLGSRSTAMVSDPTTTGPMINGQPLPSAQGIPPHGSGRPANNVALDDAIYAAGQLLKGRGRDRRKIIFLISDGANSHHNQHTYEETLRSLLEADVSVYSISVTHSIPGRSLLEHGIEHGLGLPDAYALKTGGDTFFASKQEDLDRLYSSVTEEARNEYTLTFSPHGSNKAHDYHTIEVRVRRPGLDIRSRDGYYQSALAVSR